MMRKAKFKSNDSFLIYSLECPYVGRGKPAACLTVVKRGNVQHQHICPELRDFTRLSMEDFKVECA